MQDKKTITKSGQVIILEKIKERIEVYSEEVFTNLSLISEYGKKQSTLMDSLGELLKNLFISMQVMTEGSDTIIMTIGKLENFMDRSLALIEYVVDSIGTFTHHIQESEEKIHHLIEKGEGVKNLLESLEMFNQSALNTSRNAEIKAFHAGTQGKGFEVVAKELGSLISRTFKTLGDLAERITLTSGSSEKIVKRFQNVAKTSQKYKHLIEDMRNLSQLTKEKMNSITKESDNIVEKTEKQEKIRDTLSHFLQSLSEIVKDLILDGNISSFSANQGKAGFQMLASEIGNMDIISNRVVASELNWEFNNVIIKLSQLTTILLNIFENIKETLNLLLKTDILESIVPHLKKVEGMKELIGILSTSVSNVKDSAYDTASLLQKFIQSIDDIESIVEQNSVFIKDFEDALSNLKENTNYILSHINEITNYAEMTKVISLYGKIEAARSGKEQENLMVIVDQITELSKKFNEIVEKIGNFADEIIQETDSVISNVSRMKENVNKAIESLKSNREIIGSSQKEVNYLIQIVDEMIPSVENQKEKIYQISDRFREAEKNAEGIKNRISRIWESTSAVLENGESFSETLKNIEIIPELKKKKKVINVHLGSDPVHLDPSAIGDATSNSVAHSIYRGIFEFGADPSVYPGGLSEWSLSRDGTIWKFTIRDKIMFHNGIKITSHDVVSSFKRTMKSPNAFFFDAVEDIILIDDRTFEVHLKYPYMPFTQNLATIAGSIFPPDAVETLDEHPVGIGPFAFKEWERGKYITLEAFKDYFLGTPYLDEINFVISREEKSLLKRFEDKEIDFASLPSSLVKEVKSSPGMAPLLITSPSLDVQYLGFNFVLDTPFKDKNVRKAANFAIDRKTLIEETLGGQGIPAKGVFPPGLSVYNPNLLGYNYNPEKSKELLKNAGFTEGLPDEYVFDVSDTPVNLKRAKIIQQYLDDIGIKTRINPLRWKDFLEKVHKGNSVIFILGWSSDNGDPDNFLYPLFHSKNAGEPGNASFYKNPGVDKLIEQGMTEINPRKRIEIYREAEKLIIEDAPWVFLYHGVQNYIVQPDIYGFKPHMLSIINYEFMWRDK